MEETCVKIESVQCRFETKEDCYDKAPSLFQKCFQVEFKCNSDDIKKQILDVLMENDKYVVESNELNINYQKLSPDGRFNFTLRIDNHIVDFVTSILALASTNPTTISALLTIGGALVKIFLDSIHINKGFERCIALEIVGLLNKNKTFSSEDLLDVFEDRISLNRVCPYNKLCKKITENDICFLNQSNYKKEIELALDSLEKSGVILYRNGYYTVSTITSFGHF